MGNTVLDSTRLDSTINEHGNKDHYGKLFTILLAKNVSPYVIRLLIDSYVRQQACVSWNGFKSNYFILQNGVKQGGVLSPILFTMYIDNLLIKLNSQDMDVM